MSIPVGFDFGDQYCVIGIYRNNGVDILSNQCSNRLTPTLVTYSNSRRYAGEESQQRRMENASTTFTYLKRLLALPFTSPLCERLKYAVPFELVEIPGGFTGITIQHQDRNMSLYPEQCIGYLFKDIDYHIVHPVTESNEYVISVPQCWSEIQRRSLLLSAKIAGIHVKSFLNSNTAAALCYHNRRGPETFDENKPEYIVLIDVGNSAINVAVSSFKRNSIEILCCDSDTELGGSHLSEPLIQYLLNQVKRRYNIDPTSQHRPLLRFLEAVEKTKKNLSVNKVVQFEVHSIMGVDISITVERETFHSLIQNQLLRIPKLIDKCLKSSSLTKKKINTILVLGGGSRVIAIKETIQNYFQKEPSASLDLEECFAMGCAIFGYLTTIKNPKEKPFIIKDILPYDITAVWTELNKEKKVVLFRKYSLLRSKKIFDVRVTKGNLSISIFSKGVPIGLANITTDVSSISQMVSLTAMIDRNGILSFNYSKECTLFSYSPTNFVPPQTIDGFCQFEEEMWLNDIAQTKIDEARNELESMIFKAENSIERDLVEFFTPEELTNAQKVLNECKLWFEMHEFDRLEVDEYLTRAQLLKDSISDQEKRKQEKDCF